MRTFKVHQRCDQYSVCFVKAENKEEALAKAVDDGIWEFVETQDETIIAIDELGTDGKAEFYHYLEDEEFIGTDPAK